MNLYNYLKTGGMPEEKIRNLIDYGISWCEEQQEGICATCPNWAECDCIYELTEKGGADYSTY